MSKAIALNRPPPIPSGKVFTAEGWKISLDAHKAALERAKDDERLSIITWLNNWAVGRSFPEQAVASLILEDLIKGK